MAKWIESLHPRGWGGKFRRKTRGSQLPAGAFKVGDHAITTRQSRQDAHIIRLPDGTPISTRSSRRAAGIEEVLDKDGRPPR